jgi:hypothetical protein
VKRKEIIQLGGPVLIFVLTSLLLKDLYKANDLTLFTVIVVVAGLAFLGLGLLRGKSEWVQLAVSVTYCIVIGLVVRLYVYPRNTQRDLRAGLKGKWATQFYGEERTPLAIEFLDTDSVRLFSDNRETKLPLTVKDFNHYFILSNDDEIVADWRIDELHSNRFKVTLLEEENEMSVEFERVGD